MRQAKWTNPSLVEAMTLFKDLQDSGILADGITGMGLRDARNLFFAEKAAMWMNGSWALSGAGPVAGRASTRRPALCSSRK